jgi:predicted mannosyl-3-phosphoglycerate phosphatase (HAD superfamily)
MEGERLRKKVVLQTQAIAQGGRVISLDALWQAFDAVQVRLAELEAKVEQLTAKLEEFKTKEQKHNGN